MELRNLIPRIFSLLLIIVQGGLLDYFLVKHNSMKWIAWLGTDIFVVIVWTLALLGSGVPICNFFRGWLVKRPKGNDFTATYIAWLAYMIHLVPRIVTIFTKFSHKLDKTSFLDPNFLKLTLSITPMIFICLIYSHHKTEGSFARKTYIQVLIGSITLDLFDSIEMLSYLFDKEFISKSVEHGIVAFTCFNFSLPVLALYELKNNKFHETGQVPAVSFKLLYSIAFVCLVNIPYLLIRAYLWHKYNLNASILFAKNILGIYFAVAEVLEYLGEERPVKCKECGKTFAKSHSKDHVKNCRLQKRESIQSNENVEIFI